jgi:hypothetical protein
LSILPLATDSFSWPDLTEAFPQAQWRL